ncbi:MAG TPA: shikimate dehydrogenase [Spirochaetota bacterium]|nr:shikimate dehydrogenase [Spirochaetota bacterium]
MGDNVSYKAELVGIFGYPVAENPSVIMQEAGFRALGLNWRYLTIEVYEEDLADAMKGLRAYNMRGVNLTMPHKVAVLKYLDDIAPDAMIMGAVNTVVRKGKRLIGENTDGKGFLASLRKDLGTDPLGKRVVVFGAGGAARAITVELALAGAAHIVVINRTKKRGETLVGILTDNTKTESVYVPWEKTYELSSDTDIVVNATSIGFFPVVSAKPDIDYETITNRMIVCDVVPNPPYTPFLREAEKRGARMLDGQGMVVYQGAIGFELWTGHEAPVDVMKKALEGTLKGSR